MLAKYVKKRFLSVLERVEHGSIDLVLPDGTTHAFSGAREGPVADLVLHDWSVIQMLAAKGDVGFAESYRDGLWDSSDLEQLFRFALLNESSLRHYIRGSAVSRFLAQLGYLLRMNSVRGSRRNIQQHYDLGNDFYALWLDPTMTYSSALYKKPDESLEQAQYNKYDRLLDRIDDSRGSILEIGCGWGGFAERAVARGARQVKGLTLSREQLRYADNRLRGGAEFALQDYRHERGLYDNIVSIEMFEAVGMQYWSQYFDQVGRLLRRGGKALVQSILIDEKYFEGYRKGSDTIRSYIFPGGMLPSRERFAAAAASSGLEVRDAFEFGGDYARTLRVWLASFNKALPEIRGLGYDEPFIRLWRYYLASCAASFEIGRISVAQFELQHQ